MLVSAIAGLLTLLLLPMAPSGRSLQFTPLATGLNSKMRRMSPQGNSIAYHSAINACDRCLFAPFDAAITVQ